MSSYAPANLTGRIFDNEDKRKKSQPDYSGTLNIGGVLYRVVGWRNLPSERSPKANINLKLQDNEEFKREQRDRREARQKCPDCGEKGERRGHMGCQYPSATPDQGGPPEEDFNDDIPF